MNRHTKIYGDSTSVTQRFASDNAYVRPEKLLDVVCTNTSGGTLYMQVHEISNTQITVSAAGTGAVNQAYNLQSTLTNGSPWWLSADTLYQIVATALVNGQVPSWQLQLVAGNVVQYTGTNPNPSEALFPWFASWSVNAGAAPVPAVSVPAAVAPADGVKPRFSFPVQTGLGGSLGEECDMTGIYCCWSSTQATKTIAAASGEINILIKS